MRVAIAAILLVLSLNQAEAKHHRNHQHYQHRHHAGRVHDKESRDVADPRRPSDCYGFAWCGCFLKHYLHAVANGLNLNLARDWADWGRRTVAHVGAIVVWPHHVGVIVGGSPDHWRVLSGNDGHRVRERERSVSGAIAF